MAIRLASEVILTWVIPDTPILGVDNLGYIGSRLVGINDIVLGSKIAITDTSKVYQRKYEQLRRNRLSNESDSIDRRRGVVMPMWSSFPWYVTWVSPDYSFGVTQTPQDFEVFDLLVQTKHVMIKNG